jgi:hypothetical protein
MMWELQTIRLLAGNEEIMTTEQLQVKTTATKPVRMKYGPTCPICGRVNPEGADDIAPNINIVAFRETLRRRGYPKRMVTCANSKCGHMFDARLDRVNYGERDETLPTEETFF